MLWIRCVAGAMLALFVLALLVAEHDTPSARFWVDFDGDPIAYAEETGDRRAFWVLIGADPSCASGEAPVDRVRTLLTPVLGTPPQRYVVASCGRTGDAGRVEYLARDLDVTSFEAGDVDASLAGHWKDSDGWSITLREDGSSTGTISMFGMALPRWRRLRDCVVVEEGEGWQVPVRNVITLVIETDEQGAIVLRRPRRPDLRRTNEQPRTR